MSTAAAVSAYDITDFAADLLVAAGTPAALARTVATALVDADIEGLASHGIMLLPMYLDRIVAGSVAPTMEGRVVSDTGAQIVIDADNGLGQMASPQLAAATRFNSAPAGGFPDRWRYRVASALSCRIRARCFRLPAAR